MKGENPICTFSPWAADANWAGYWGRHREGGGKNSSLFTLDVEGKKLEGSLQAEDRDGAVTAKWNFTAKDAVSFATLVVAAEFGLAEVAGGRWKSGGSQGEIPRAFGKTHIFNAVVSDFLLAFPNGREMQLKFSKPTYVLLQDNRQWGTASFSLRVGRGDGSLAAGENFAVEMNTTLPGGMSLDAASSDAQPLVLKADDEWIPLQEDLEIEPGSALDFSGYHFTDGPCGSKGRVIATADGGFALSSDPKSKKRFYGVNLCYSAQYLAKEETDRLLDRLVRLGYNTLRIHHYEPALTAHKPGFDWDPAKIDQLDYLLAGCAKRGLWITTDVYVSRPVDGAQVGLPPGELTMDRFKLLVLVHEPAFQDWAKFAKKFLDRVNPYTGKRLADDPAIAWVSLINEGPATNYWSQVQRMPEWKTAWNEWLVKRFATRDAVAKAFGDLEEGEDPAKGTVELPKALLVEGRRSQIGQEFVVAKQKDFYERARAFLRDELGCQALLTDMNNAGPAVAALQSVRDDYDYVDEHFYVDHPSFLETPWRLPSSCPNTNPIQAGTPAALNIARCRLYNKPFTITEYNYSGPGRFRGVGGILTGAMAALQDWSGLWRFAYSHSRERVTGPGPIHYFDLASDPLNLAADRLALLLYLRGDIKTAPTRLAVILPEDATSAEYSLSALQAAPWITQVGSLVEKPGASVPPGYIPISPEKGKATDEVQAALEKITGKSAADGYSVRSETGEMTLDFPSGKFVVDAPKSAGGYAEAGGKLESPASGVEIDGLSIGASVFVSSLDANPIRSSSRLLVTHLTDLQNTGIKYREARRQTLLEWGGLPHLVRAGTAVVRLALEAPEKYEVWALSTGGRRTERVPAKIEGGKLVFTADVKGSNGARMLYEIVKKM